MYVPESNVLRPGATQALWQTVWRPWLLPARSAWGRCGRLAAVSLRQPIVKRIL